MSKDTGEKTSRLGQIKEAAGKVPGPGTYSLPVVGLGNRFFRFSKTAKDKYGASSKVPGPGHYEKAPDACIAVKARCIGGKSAKCAKRSFLDNAIHQSKEKPDPTHYKPSKPKPYIMSPSFQEKKTESRSEKKKEIPGPGAYDPKPERVYERILQYTVPKEKGKSFVERVTTSKEIKNKPGPGSYNSIELGKIALASKWNHIHGYSRNQISGRY